MAKQSILRVLSSNLEKLDGGATYLRTYGEIPTGGLFTAQLTNRPSKSWPKAQFLTTSTSAQGRPLNECIKQWVLMCENYNNQYLIIEDNHIDYLVDSKGMIIAEGDEVEPHLQALTIIQTAESPDNTFSSEKMRELFTDFCKTCAGFRNDDTARNYASNLNNVDKEIRKIFPDFTSCYDYTSISTLKPLADRLLKDHQFVLTDQDAKYNLSNALKWYLHFLKAYDIFASNTTSQNPPALLPKDTGIQYIKYIRAIKTKPFLLLAGISGTGKSRIVRELARSCWPIDSEEYKAHKPSNYEMVQVKPNWHDSSELIGYVSRIGGNSKFVIGNFIKFVANAWEHPDTPYFLCLDEMNLAPVEQYFAEYLSVVESRKLQPDRSTILTDALMKKEAEDWYYNLCCELTSDEYLRKQFLNDGITIPQNLIIVGTVNMDETTYSFSRKVLDRAMTIEMNEVNLESGLTHEDCAIGHIDPECFIARNVEGYDVWEYNQDICTKVIDYLQSINNVLDGTPFKIAYRTRNEFLLYAINAISLNGNANNMDSVLASALDEVTGMKILSRIEGDKRKVHFLEKLEDVIKNGLDKIDNSLNHNSSNSESLKKLTNMQQRLSNGYTSFWE